MVDINKLLEEGYFYASPYTEKGKLVSYIPALAKVDKRELGVTFINKNGEIFQYGDANKKFTIMSIVKVILTLIALEVYPIEEIMEKVDCKGSSKPYNSLLDLEMSEGKKPVNPFINSGAIAVTYLIVKKFGDKALEIILDKVKELTGNKDISVDESIVELSKSGGQGNKAIAYSLQNNGIIGKEVDVNDILSVYNQACSIMVTTLDLAKISYVLSNNGKDLSGEEIIKYKTARTIRILMSIAGTYDYSGNFAMDVGLPAKSGVGGGIIATTNVGDGIATYSPGLDERGNSLAGIKLLKYISIALDLSIY